MTVAPPILSAAHRRALIEGSGLSEAVIDGRGYRSLDAADLLALSATNPSWPTNLRKAGGAIAIPVWRPDRQHHCDILRLDQPLGKIKYYWPVGTRNALDVHPEVLALVREQDVPLVVTEGVKKADAILSRADMEHDPLVALAINGCWGWKASAGPDAGTTVTPDFYDLVLQGRRIFVIPDSDYFTNGGVRRGWDELVRYLASKAGEGHVTLAIPPSDGLAKMGADDYLREHSLSELLGLARSPDVVFEAPVTRWRTLDLVELNELSKKTMEWLVKMLIPPKAIVVMAGNTATYKTFHAFQLAVDLLAGGTFAGHPDLGVEKTGRTLYVNKEMGEDQLAKRLRQLEVGLGLDPDAFSEEHRTDFVLVQDAQVDFNQDDACDLLVDYIEEFDARLVVFDSLSMVWSGDENSASEVGGLYQKLRGVIEKTGATILLIHHFSKPDKQKHGYSPIFSVRGSGQIIQQADVALLMEAGDKDDDGATVTLHQAKSRYTQEMPKWINRVTDDGAGVKITFVGRASDQKAEAVVSAEEAKEDARAKLIEYVRSLSEEIPALQGAGVSTKTFLNLLAGHWPDRFVERAPSEATFRRALKDMVELGLLRVEPGPRKVDPDMYWLPEVAAEQGEQA